MRITVSYRSIPGLDGFATGDHLCRALRQLGHVVTPYAKVYQSEQWIGKGDPGCDLLIWLECNEADPQYLELAGWSCPKIMWDFDTAMHEKETFALAEILRPRRVFFANLKMASKTGASYLPYGVDVDVFRPSMGAPSGVAIIGTPFGERKAFADTLGVPVISGVFGNDYISRLSSLAIHVHYLDSGGDGMVVMRPLETMACGVCLLAPQTIAMRTLFVAGVHYAGFSDTNDAESQLNYLNGHPDYREQLANRGRNAVVSNHTYRHRAEELLS